MKLPIITYKYNGNKEAKQLATVVDQKISALEKFIDDNADITIDVEFEKISAQNQGRIYRMEVTLLINGELYRADATEESFEKAIDVVRDELDRELRRAKDKNETLERKGSREIKDQLLNE